MAMSACRPWSGVALVVLAGAALSGCGNRDGVAPIMPPPAAPLPGPLVAAAAGRTPRELYEASLQALQRGDMAAARPDLVALLAIRPDDRRAALLLREIDTDPQQLYGTDHFSYTIQSGDTLFSLARRYLRDPLNFVGLARYNDVALPADLRPGQTILIPGHPPAAAPARPRITPRPSGKPSPTVVGPPTATDRSDAARQRAQHLRSQGLEQMSAGSIDRAVTLLSQANSLLPSDEAIAADLARARRIQATVRDRQ